MTLIICSRTTYYKMASFYWNDQKPFSPSFSLSSSATAMSLFFISPPSLSSLPTAISGADATNHRAIPRSLSLSSRPNSFIRHSSLSSEIPDPIDPTPVSFSDEWGEKAEPEPETSYTRFTDPDPPKNEDEWEEGFGSGNGPAQIGGGGGSNWELKKCLVDSVYGSGFGLRASSEVRAEVFELVNQLEAANPNPNATEVPALLDGNWVLAYTAFSELLPLLAIDTLPLLKVERISQAVDTGNQTVENCTTLSTPFSTVSFSASATFEVRSPSRIQVQFKEAIFKPPEIKSRLDLPENINIFGQKISLNPVQQTLNPVQEAVANLTRAISGQPPLKVPIPGDRTQSWLLITYLDEDLRISRGDGGLFVLVREGSPLLEEQ